MIKYLIQRPIAVFMTALAFIILGTISIFKIPTSLLPDIAVPEITIQISYPNSSAKNIENAIVKPLRNQLLQIANIKDIQSESRDGLAVIKLTFDFNTNINYAFIEANEKIDGALLFLPKDLKRPKVIKAAASDIPILYLSIYNKNNDEIDFLKLSEFTESIIKRRIEQLPDIAIADINGIVKPEISIKIDEEKVNSLSISHQEIINTIKENNFELGNLLIQNGIYQYQFRFSNPLQNIDDLKNIYLKKNDRILQLKDIAKVSIENQQERGFAFYNKERCINIAIIKQADARVNNLEESLNTTINQFKKDYPQLEFKTIKDQTKLLKLSIDNLLQSLIIGSLLAIIILFLFIEDLQSPIIIGLSIPISLLLSFLFMYWFGISINVISLSGLILGVGNMIDNAVIVIDNISQKLKNNYSLLESCVEGIQEIITPLISSLLTACGIFIPLVFLSGISGALFYDQAIAVTIGLTASLIVSIFIIPVLFYYIKKRTINYKLPFSLNNVENWYEKGFNYFFEKKTLTFSIVAFFLIVGIILIQKLPYEKLPKFSENEIELFIDWNENITLKENYERTISLNKNDSELFLSEIGENQYLLNKEQTKSLSETNIFIAEKNIENINKTKNKIDSILKGKYPNAVYKFSPQKNLFEYIFGSDERNLVANFYSNKSNEEINFEDHEKIASALKYGKPIATFQNQIIIDVNFENLKLYSVSYSNLLETIQSLFNQNTIDNLKTSQKFIPIKINNYSNADNILNNSFVKNDNLELIPLRNLVKTRISNDFKTIFGDKLGTKLMFTIPQNKIELTKEKINPEKNYKIEFTGNIFELDRLKSEMLIILTISMLMLYLIMAAQFESLIQPLIILIEIPIDIGGALLFLYLFNETINIMSVIGIIIMSGIVITDSILKIHTINELKNSGIELKKAIKIGGTMRLKSILITSLTTILALIPVLFGDGLGNEMQKPLAITLIGGMIIGTFVSLYFVPYIYYQIYKNEENNNSN